MLTQEQIQRYEQDGFLVVKQLLTLEECDKLKSTVHRLIDEWEPETDYSWLLPNGQRKGKSRSLQMVESGNTVSFFIEEDAVDPNTGKLNRDKHVSVSAIGHPLHIVESEFKKHAFSDKMKGILHDLNFIKPAIRQTLYIFKQPFIGEEVSPHRDSTYLYNDPFKVVGVWIALEDTKVENGCLWFIPGSHKGTATQRYIRNPNKEEFDAGNALIFTGEKEPYDKNAFVPVEIKAGDAILIHGETWHKSEKNTSPITRQICAFHYVETHNSVYSKENWLQPTTSFQLVYDQ